jgi:hypothetical protein
VVTVAVHARIWNRPLQMHLVQWTCTPACCTGRNAWAAAAHRWYRGTALIQKPFCKRDQGGHPSPSPRLLASQTPPFLASTPPPPPPPPRKDMSRTARNILHLRSPVWLVGGRCTGERTIVGKPLVDEKKISFYCRFQSFSNVGS